MFSLVTVGGFFHIYVSCILELSKTFPCSLDDFDVNHFILIPFAMHVGRARPISSNEMEKRFWWVLYYFCFHKEKHLTLLLPVKVGGEFFEKYACQNHGWILKPSPYSLNYFDVYYLFVSVQCAWTMYWNHYILSWLVE